MKITFYIVVGLIAVAALWYYFGKTEPETAKKPCGCGCSGAAPCTGTTPVAPVAPVVPATSPKDLTNIATLVPSNMVNPIPNTRYTSASPAETPAYAELI